jgi:hypothetical protein
MCCQPLWGSTRVRLVKKGASEIFLPSIFLPTASGQRFEASVFPSCSCSGSSSSNFPSRNQPPLQTEAADIRGHMPHACSQRHGHFRLKARAFRSRIDLHGRSNTPLCEPASSLLLADRKVSLNQQNGFLRRMNALFELSECLLLPEECITSASRMHSVTPHGPFFGRMNAFCRVKEGFMCPQRMGDVGSKNGHFRQHSHALVADMVWNLSSKSPPFAIEPTAMWDQTRHAMRVKGPFLAPQAGQECPEYESLHPLQRSLLAQRHLTCSQPIGFLDLRYRRGFGHRQQGTIQIARPSSPHLMHHGVALSDHAA